MPNATDLEHSLLCALKNIPQHKRYWVGFSGGLDSTVLLFLFHKLKSKLDSDISAVHINHGLQAVSDDWATHCVAVCKKFDITLNIYNLTDKPKPGESIEAWARESRYDAFSKLIGNDECIVTAHNQNDQAETVLLQLFRGAGAAGLSAMPVYKKESSLITFRPLLEHSREEIEYYAKQNNLEWIEDLTNYNTKFDRNYIRKEILPKLQMRWPSIVKTLYRSSKLQAEHNQLIEAVYDKKVDELINDNKDVLSITKLKNNSTLEQKVILRSWIKKNNFRYPSENILNQILQSALESDYDKTPLVSFGGCDIRRFRNNLYIMKSIKEIDFNHIDWDINQEIKLPYGVLSVDENSETGIQKTLLKDGHLTVRYRKGGEKIKPLGRKNHHELKKLFQDASVVPWMRDRIPLIYLGNKLIAVPNLWVSDSEATSNKNESVNFNWDSDFRLIANSEK